jgi:hypothetical protein
MNKIAFLSLVNILSLGYLAWTKYGIGRECASCSNIPFLPVTDLTMAMTGILASLVLVTFSLFSHRFKLLGWVMLIVAGVFAGFASLLAAGRLLFNMAACYPCLAVSVGFYLIFGLLLYDILIKPSWQRFVVLGVWSKSQFKHNLALRIDCYLGICAFEKGLFDQVPRGCFLFARENLKIIMQVLLINFKENATWKTRNKFYCG